MTWWICAFNKTPASLLVGDDAFVKWIVTKCSVWCIWWTSPAFNGWGYFGRKMRRKNTKTLLFDAIQLIIWIWFRSMGINCGVLYRLMSLFFLEQKHDQCLWSAFLYLEFQLISFTNNKNYILIMAFENNCVVNILEWYSVDGVGVNSWN